MLLKSPSQLEWIFADRVFEVPKSDKDYYAYSSEEYPCQVVQIYPNNRYAPSPFRIREKRFKKAFSKAIREFGIEKIKTQKTAKPSKDLIELIYKNYG